MRIAQACKECRCSKKKCRIDPAQPEGPCLTCQDRHVSCSQSLKKRTSSPATQASRAVFPATRPVHDVPKDHLRFVELYLRFIHERPHSLFHEKSLWLDIHNGTISEPLLLAICALGCRFSTIAGERQLDLYLAGKSLRRRARTWTGNVVFWYGVKFRPHVKTDTSQEIKCRVWWSLYMADCWCPPGRALPRELVNIKGHLDLPMDELDFQAMDSNKKRMPETRAYGLWRQKILLVMIFGSIQTLNASLVYDTHDRLAVDEKVAHITQSLQAWQDALPSHMTMTDANLELHRSTGQGGTFVALHLGYHHYSTLLYFHYLEAALDPRAGAVPYAEECRSHALAFSKLLCNARKKDDCHVVYLTVAHMAMVSSSVLLHMLLFGNSHEIVLAHAGLISNFEALLELKTFWPHLHEITQRLLRFQHMCLKFSSATTFTVDRWMLRFLFEHGLPLANRDVVDTIGSPELHAPLQRKDSLGQAFMELCA